MLKMHFLIVLALLATHCNNYDLVDKLQNPGSSSGSTGPFVETFTTNNYIFVTSWTVNGTMDMSASPYPDCNTNTGANRADCACSRAAATNGLRKSSSHVFRGWLSTSSADAKCRVQALGNGCMTNIAATWFNTQGQAVVNNYNGFEAALLVAVRYSESRADIGPDLVWTGTSLTGSFVGTGADCTSWGSTAPANGTVGSRMTNTSPTWVNDGSATACNTTQRIYCVASP